MIRQLTEQVEREIIEYSLAARGECIIVAVSGGPDSVMLLHVLFLLSKKWSWRLVAAHVNHGFRGFESDGEERFTSEFAESYGIPCETVHLDMPRLIAETGKNAQAAAREKRYAFLRQVARKHCSDKIALAHHADDQAETVLMGLLRGSGAAGLAGMAPLRQHDGVAYIRPLLGLNKQEIVQYLDAAGLDYCHDSSNDSRKYFRNQIRLDILPYLAKFNPDISRTLNRTAAVLLEEDAYMQEQTEKIAEQAVQWVENGCLLNRRSIMDLPIALQRRLIKLILNYLSFRTEQVGFSSDYSAIESFRTAIIQNRTPSLTIHTGGSLQMRREYDELLFTENSQSDSFGETSYPFVIPKTSGEIMISEAGLTIEYGIHKWPLDAKNEAGIMGRDGSIAAFDLEGISFPLCVRTRKPGDRMKPFGLKGTKKVKNIFIDQKISPSRRLVHPLVVDSQDQLLWIPGILRSAHAPLTEESQHAFVLSLHTYNSNNRMLNFPST